MNVRSIVFASLTLAFLVAGTGCANNKTSAERDSLLSQNEDLKKQLDAERAARTAADSRANALTSAATTAPAEGVTPPAMEAGAPLDLSSGPTGARSSRTGASAEGISTNRAGEVVLEIPGDVLFDSGKAKIKPSATKTLDGIAATLKKSYAGKQIRVEGHTDPSPVKGSGWDDNWDLGAARARSVMLYLREKGVKNMYIASFAATEPKSTKNQALNRRVDIVVVQNAK